MTSSNGASVMATMPSLVSAVISRDYQLVQGLALVFALLVLAITLLVDLTQALLDPRRLAAA